MGGIGKIIRSGAIRPAPFSRSALAFQPIFSHLNSKDRDSGVA